MDDPIARIWATIEQQRAAVSREQIYRQAKERARKAASTADRKRKEIEQLMPRG